MKVESLVAGLPLTLAALTHVTSHQSAEQAIRETTPHTRHSAFFAHRHTPQLEGVVGQTVFSGLHNRAKQLIPQ